MSRPLLSVVIIGRNEGVRLERCLASVARSASSAATPAVACPEVVYVDSASSDGSAELARSRGALVLQQESALPTAAGARNAGAARSTGDFILFLDGDTILDPCFIESALAEFRETAMAVVWGQRRESHPRASAFNTVVDLDWIAPPGVLAFCGGDALFRRSAFEQAGGYDKSLIAGEEPDLCCRLKQLGWELRYLGIPMTQHDIAMHSFSQYWRRAVRTGYAYAQVSKRFEASSIPLWKAESRRNRNRALAFGLGACVCLAGCAWTTSAWPIGAALSVFAGLVLRTSIKNRWRSPDLWVRLLYGVHSHLQQIPIYFGQRQFQNDARHALTRPLIEYKTTP